MWDTRSLDYGSHGGVGLAVVEIPPCHVLSTLGGTWAFPSSLTLRKSI